MKNVCSPVLWFMLPSNSTTVCVSLSGIQSVAMFAFCPCLLPLLLIVHDLSRKVGGGWFQRFRYPSVRPRLKCWCGALQRSQIQITGEIKETLMVINVRQQVQVLRAGIM